MSSEITFVFDEQDGERIVRWKPAGAAGSARSRSTYIEGPECPIHGPWIVKQNKAGESFYSCRVADGEDWCKNRAGRDFVRANPPESMADDGGYGGYDDPLA